MNLKQLAVKFLTLIERMLHETVTLDDAKALFLNHEDKLTRRKVIENSLLSSVNLNVSKNQMNSKNLHDTKMESGYNGNELNSKLSQMNFTNQRSLDTIPQYNNNVNIFYSNSQGYYKHEFRPRRGHGFGRERDKPQCQLCDKKGHLVSTCWFRFDKNFRPLVQIKTTIDHHMCHHNT